MTNVLTIWGSPPSKGFRPGPEKIRVGKLLKLPPLEFESTEPHRLPPSKSGRKTPSITPPPPRIHGTSSTTPPRNRAGKLPQLPPRIHGNSSTTPPRNWAGKLPQLPPRIHGTHRLPPYRNRAGKLPSTTPPRNRPERKFASPQIQFLDPPLIYSLSLHMRKINKQWIQIIKVECRRKDTKRTGSLIKVLPAIIVNICKIIPEYTTV